MIVAIARADPATLSTLGENECYGLGRIQIQLRVAPSRNNQARGVNWADDFAFERLRFDLPGAVAQLGERPDGIRKVRGSIPLGSMC